ncbi:MAG TPA: hypothetical protein VMH77_01470 [Steroidobacteraceae bacterium]|nr:hypothetical protein [Steroidobacteraceae bacterium]
MRELDSTEIMNVSGAGVNFTTPLTLSMLNDISVFGGVTRFATAAFSAGYALGTYLNDEYDISTKVVDVLTKRY